MREGQVVNEEISTALARLQDTMGQYDSLLNDADKSRRG